MTSVADPRAFLRALFDTAVAAALPTSQLSRFLPPPPKGRTLVVGAGKGAAAMAHAIEDMWPGPLSGLAVTRYGHGLPTRAIEVIEAAHPNPDIASETAARRILAEASALGEDDLLLCLISGGGSALMALPAPGLTLDDKKAVTRELLKSGAAIDEINAVRKHLSAIKGGRLAAAAAPAQVVTLMVSDVPGDDPAVIASGPTVADPSTFADARAVIEKYGIAVPDTVRRHLEQATEESVKPGDPRLARTTAHLVATPQDALEAAADLAYRAGIAPLILGNALEGESREVARVIAAMARQATLYDQPATPPCVLLSGGETTVTVRGNGRGGRNAEFLLALAVALGGHDKVWAIACDTDGIDGTEDNAGAILTPDTLARAAALGVDAKARLADNDGYGFFSALGDLVVTGPTRTNVNDFRAVLILP
ncbi:glycerate kinase type-2 family protein [Magnetospirillum aberrantis]|uniref:Glycerate kinase n=1 Tax=Magnetospirillum aberrantis SpK TaxID=908842 RepID=A0A7C9QWG6_9PROT|nr:glycerate kinase [Magnetospirillum aberrantis]NFV82304.1 glycerate kinase [Magnetospirillum aberrantis SpK]